MPDTAVSRPYERQWFDMTLLHDVDDISDGIPKASGSSEVRHLPLQRKTAADTDTAAASAFAMTPSGPIQGDADFPITEILARAAGGDSAAIDALIPKIYATLRRLARRQRSREGAHTLDTTALVHEAYLQLANRSGITFADRAHLYAYMSQVMRHILVDHARRKKAQKRQAPEIEEAQEESEILDVLAIDEAMNRLAAVDARLARIAELRLFADLSSPEIAEIVGLNARTVERDWLKARTFLSSCLLPQT